MTESALPAIIQGGMGVAVSDWRLARAVSFHGHLGVVSGTGLDSVLVRRLHQGDPSGALRRALEHFPAPDVTSRILDTYLGVPATSPEAPFPVLPLLDEALPRARRELLAAANFVEVFLAKEGHGGPVGINYMEKIQAPMLASLYGAMLAGVDYVLVGAGIPLAIPGALDCLARGETVGLDLAISGDARGHVSRQVLDPTDLLPDAPTPLPRPRFLAIVASDVVARSLVRRATGPVDGFVLEGHAAGGHNAPPRGAARTLPGDQPSFGPRDEANLETIRGLGLPFWLAGGQASPRALSRAQSAGAVGIQVGTAFALCEESGLLAELKQRVIDEALAGTLTVRTDFRASPTGFPFKVADLPGTMADPAANSRRSRVCDLGYLRQAYRKDDGAVGFRCPGEPEASYRRKGGDPSDAEGRLCLCNGLVTAVGLGQRRGEQAELPLVTLGEDLSFLPYLHDPQTGGYAAKAVLDYLLR